MATPEKKLPDVAAMPRFLKDAIPKPDLSKLPAEMQKREDQLAADEANNLVLQRDPVALPAEAQAFTNPVPAEAPTQQFVNPSAPAATRAPADAGGIPASVPAPAVAAPTAPDQTKALNDVSAKYEAAANDTQTQIDKLNQERMAAIDKHMADDEKNVEKVKPTELFAGKATWQKILGGVGMFLGSITPEGAKNVANMIDKEIERDQQLQLNNIKLKRDKGDRHYQNLLQKYGSQEAALLAKKKDAYTALGFHVQKLELASRNAETRARLAQGAQEIELKKQAINVDLQKAALAAQQAYNKGAVPGYQGQNQNPTIVKDFTERVTAKNSAMNKITQLEELLKKGALTPGTENYKLAQQIRTDLGADIAKAKFGRSSDSELGISMGLIPDITSLTQRGSVDEKLLKNLRTTISKDVDAAAAAAGFTKPTVATARKM